MAYNEVVEDARRVRRRCERKFRKSHSEVDQEAYFDVQKTVSTVINNAKTEYYTEKLSGCDSKCMFKVVNELLNKNNRSYNSCEDLEDQFCDFFNNKIDKIRGSS